MDGAWTIWVGSVAAASLLGRLLCALAPKEKLLRPIVSLAILLLLLTPLPNLLSDLQAFSHLLEDDVTEKAENATKSAVLEGLCQAVEEKLMRRLQQEGIVGEVRVFCEEDASGVWTIQRMELSLSDETERERAAEILFLETGVMPMAG